MSDEPHSALYLTDARDLWWNPDFLGLVAQRTNLKSARRVLDVGCGVGHWTRTVARLLSPGAAIIGLDREHAWVDKARADAPVDGVSLSFQQGDGQALPFDAGSFDVVTCQTFLIHVQDPRAVVREMVRVLRPGGRLLLAEPNNLAEGIARLVVSPDFNVEDVVAWFRLAATCEKGKHALGLGYNSLGESLAGLIDSDTVDDVHVWNNDKVAVFLPGEDRSRRADLVDERRILDTGALAWSPEETRRYFLAGGGRDADFDALWTVARRVYSARLDALERGGLSQNAGSLFYLLSARRR